MAGNPHGTHNQLGWVDPIVNPARIRSCRVGHSDDISREPALMTSIHQRGDQICMDQSHLGEFFSEVGEPIP